MSYKKENIVEQINEFVKKFNRYPKKSEFNSRDDLPS